MTYDSKSAARTIKYAKTNYKRVPLDLKLSDYEILVETAQAVNQTVNAFIKQAIADRIQAIKK